MFDRMVDPVEPGPWDVGGDLRMQPTSAYAVDRLPGFAAVLSARALQLDGAQLLELILQTSGCVAQLDFVRCAAICALVLDDNRSPLVTHFERPGVSGGPVLCRFGGDGTPTCSEFLPAEVALVLSVSEPEATRWIALALDLRFRLRHTSHHFSAGRISLGHARVIAETTRVLSWGQVEPVEERLAEAALTRTPARLRVLARRLVAKADPAGLRQRHARAVAQRSADLYPLDDAMATFSLNHTLETLAVIDDQLNAWARHRLGADPTPGFLAHKADAATCLLLARHPLTGAPLIPETDPEPSGSAVASPPLPETAPPGMPDVSTVPDPTGFLPARTELRVTLSADTLLGVDPDGDCHLHGYGPLTPDQARRLALHTAPTVLRRVFTDPADDAILYVDPRRYRFTTQQTDTIHARHPLSTFPGSTRPARQCDLDHIVEYTTARGDPDTADPPDADPPGQTVVDNAQPLHRRGHRLKTHGGWHVEADPHDPHTLHWTSPHGRHYTVHDHDGA